ncbi:MAG TPA: M28 family peptidase, partial [Thermoleophilaceae bacterium]
LAETPQPSAGRVVMAGAHVDSVPEGPGINGNGSGVAALLELAKALGGKAPGARIRLGFWGAEEPGLFGSTYYVGQLSAAAKAEIAAYVNLDVIGSRRPKRAVYSGGDAAIESLLRDLVGPKAVAEDQAKASSDHVPFQAAGIPIGGLFTGAGKPWDACYHRACDRVSNVNLNVLVQLTRVTGQALTRLSRQAK